MSKEQKFPHYEGQWWTPDDAQNKYLGALSFSRRNGLRLELKVPHSRAMTSQESQKVIHGHDEHGHPITLFYCVWAGTQTSGALTTLSYNVGYCFHGSHFLRWSEALFDEATVHFTDLESWINISGFKQSAGKVWTIEYDVPEEIEFATGQGFRLILAPSVTHRHKADSQSISEGWSLRLEYKRQVPFRTIRKHLFGIRQLLMLAAKRPIAQTSFVTSAKVNRKKVGGRLFPNRIKCFTPGMGEIEGDQKRIRPIDMLFTFQDVRLNFEKLLMEWFTYSVTFEDALSLYFTCLENKHLYGNHQILFLAQALEVYHRTHTKRYRQAVESNADFKARCKRLTTNLTPEDAKWLGDKLQWTNQPTLNNRLLEIFESKRSLLKDFLEDEAAFAKRIKDLRNHYTHYTAKKNKRPQMGLPEDSFELCYKMCAVLQVCFLSDVGVPDHIIKRLLRKFDWTIITFTEADEDEVPPTAPLGTPLLKAPTKRGKPRK